MSSGVMSGGCGEGLGPAGGRASASAVRLLVSEPDGSKAQAKPKSPPSRAMLAGIAAAVFVLLAIAGGVAAFVLPRGGGTEAGQPEISAFGQLGTANASAVSLSLSTSGSDFVYTRGFACIDGAMAETSTPSAAVCEAKCLAVPSCVSFVFDPNGGSCRVFTTECSSVKNTLSPVVRGTSSTRRLTADLTTQADASCSFACPPNSYAKDWVTGCPNYFWDCECQEGFARSNGQCICDSNYSCPANSVPKVAVGNCPKYFWDCACEAGFVRDSEIGECSASDYECPEKSSPKPEVTLPLYFWDCECESGYSRANGACECSYQCPDNSSPLDNIECPSEFSECECASDYKTVNTGLKDGRCDFAGEPEDGGSERLSEGREYWGGPGSFREGCYGKGTGYCGYAWWEGECPDQCQKVCSKRRRQLLSDDDEDRPDYKDYPGRWGMRRAISTGNMDQVYIGEAGIIEGKFCVASCKSKSYDAGCYESVQYKGQKYCNFVECEDFEIRTTYIDGCHHEDKDFHDLDCKSCERLWPSCKDSDSFDDDDNTSQSKDDDRR